MLFEIVPMLYVGDLDACSHSVPNDPHPVLQAPHATIHALKHPCHQRAVGYRYSLPSNHPHYLALTLAGDLYLNMIDPATPLFQLETFWKAQEFMAAQPGDRPILIHCNQGLSRAPALALIRLVQLGLSPAPREDYDAQHAWFSTLYPFYAPGAGLALYLRTHWLELITGRPKSSEQAA